MSVMSKAALPLVLASGLLAGCATHSDGSAPSIKGPGLCAACLAGSSAVAWAPSKVPAGRPVPVLPG